MGYIQTYLKMSTAASFQPRIFIPIFINNFLMFGPPQNNDCYKHISFATPESDFTAPTFKEFMELFKL